MDFSDEVCSQQISQKQQFLSPQRDEPLPGPCLHRGRVPGLSHPQARHQHDRVHHDGEYYQVRKFNIILSNIQ